MLLDIEQLENKMVQAIQQKGLSEKDRNYKLNSVYRSFDALRKHTESEQTHPGTCQKVEPAKRQVRAKKDVL